MKYFRFNLATLLAVIGVIALPLGYLSQAGFAEAQFEVQADPRNRDYHDDLSDRAITSRGSETSSTGGKFFSAVSLGPAVWPVSEAGCLRDVSDDEARIQGRRCCWPTKKGRRIGSIDSAEVRGCQSP